MSGRAHRWIRRTTFRCVGPATVGDVEELAEATAGSPIAFCSTPS